MQRISLTYLFLLLLAFSACKKEEMPQTDPRDELAGMYLGNMISTEWGQSGTSYVSNSDTLTDYQMHVHKVGSDKIGFAPNTWFAGDTLQFQNEGVGMYWSGNLPTGTSYSKTVSFDTAQKRLVYLFQYDTGMGSGGSTRFDGMLN